MLLSPGTAVVPRRLCKHTCGGAAQPAPAFERNPQCGSRSRRGAERRYPAVLPGGGGPIGGHGSADERRGRLQPHETGHRLPHGEPYPPHARLAGPYGAHARAVVSGWKHIAGQCAARPQGRRKHLWCWARPASSGRKGRWRKPAWIFAHSWKTRPGRRHPNRETANCAGFGQCGQGGGHGRTRYTDWWTLSNWARR